MYSKHRNTLTALIAATLFVASGWLLGRPVPAAEPGLPGQGIAAAAPSQVAIVSGTALHAHHASRMSLAMPYYSFSLASQGRAD